MKLRTKLLYFLVMWLQVHRGDTDNWGELMCSTDTDQRVPEGVLPKEQTGRFSWLGVIQHGFYLGGKMHFAVTTAILIHPEYAIAPAEDMAKIQPKFLQNNTHYILWQSDLTKYVLDVVDYTLHPEYVEEVTFATIALVTLVTDGQTNPGHEAPILPVCLPLSGAGSFEDLYVAKMTDETGELKKEIYKMDFIENMDCNMFYDKSGLNYKKMIPTEQLCAVVSAPSKPCVWDGGAALITRQSWGQWKLLGFGVRGPGCAAPTRFVSMNRQMEWLSERVSQARPDDTTGDMVMVALRVVSPNEVIMYTKDSHLVTEEGQCGRNRGSVMFKEDTEVSVDKNFAQGYYFLSVAYIADFSCVMLRITSEARSNMNVWIEHHCSRDLAGASRPNELRKLECFVYFRTTAYIEFRFQFSFKAQVELTVYGRDNLPVPLQLRPYVKNPTTISWFPTDPRLFRWKYWVPTDAYWYDM